MTDTNHTTTEDTETEVAQTRVMVDIETLGLNPGATIISIGAVEFGPGRLGETFYRSVDLESCQDAGLDIDAGTLDWWIRMDSDTQDQLMGGDDLSTVLSDFSDWLTPVDEVWANSPSFDCEMLEAAYDAVDIQVPWEYYEERDFRTLKNLPVAADIDQEHDGDEHDALDDAKHQAWIAAAALSRFQEAQTP